MKGFLRADGRKGIRNSVVVVYLVECAHHVAKTIVNKIDHEDVQLIGFPGCYPNDYSTNDGKTLHASKCRWCSHCFSWL